MTLPGMVEGENSQTGRGHQTEPGPETWGGGTDQTTMTHESARRDQESQENGEPKRLG